jgi:hypothetical protein
MLLWAGSFKMTAPGAEGIISLVSNSPLISWHFKLFGPYIGSDLIGLTEWLAAILIIAGYFRPKAGIVGGLITTVMFSTTSTMVVTTFGAMISVPGIHGMRYMSNFGLFLFKDVISPGIVLPDQLFRQESDLFRRQMLLTETEGAVGWHMGSAIRQSRLRSGPATGSRGCRLAHD